MLEKILGGTAIMLSILIVAGITYQLRHPWSKGHRSDLWFDIKGLFLVGALLLIGAVYLKFVGGEGNLLLGSIVASLMVTGASFMLILVVFTVLDVRHILKENRSRRDGPKYEVVTAKVPDYWGDRHL